MVYFLHTHTFVLNAVKEPGIFWGGCPLIKAFGNGSQWVNLSQIAFNIIISPTHTPCKVVKSRFDFYSRASQGSGNKIFTAYEHNSNSRA